MANARSDVFKKLKLHASNKSTHQAGYETSYSKVKLKFECKEVS